MASWSVKFLQLVCLLLTQLACQVFAAGGGPDE